MAIKIDDALLQELGLAELPVAEKTKLKSHIYDTLELNVGTVLADRMSEAQLDEFEQFMQTKDQAGAMKWLEANFPDYPKVVESEFAKLTQQVRQDAPKILAAAKSQN